MNEVKTKVTGTDLAERGLDALDVTHYDEMPVDNQPVPGAIASVDWMKIFDLGKALAAMKEGMPAHVRGAWGIGCRIATNAYNWKMDPFAIADQTYVVNNRLAYMSQLIHALINLNAPLQHRLTCEYIGKDGDLQCIVRGQFYSGDEREYVTPKLKDIKIKNSPLWQTDPEQQLWYFGVRSWGRKWVPEVMLGVYTKEELEADPNLGYEPVTPGLHARLKGSTPAKEGHQAGHAAAQLDEIQNGGPIDHDPGEFQERTGVASDETAPEGSDTPRRAKRTSKLPKGKTGTAEDSPKAKRVRIKVGDVEIEGNLTPPRKTEAKLAPPANVPEYIAYAKRWIKAESDKVEIGNRWARERSMRNKLGVTFEDRQPVEQLINKKINE